MHSPSEGIGSKALENPEISGFLTKKYKLQIFFYLPNLQLSNQDKNQSRSPEVHPFCQIFSFLMFISCNFSFRKVVDPQGTMSTGSFLGITLLPRDNNFPF